MSAGVRERWILFFAYYFPPDDAIGAARPYRFYRYLPANGFRSHVITAADVARCPELQAQHIDDPYPRLGASGFGGQLERLVRKVLLPGDINLQWSQRAFRAACKFVDEHPDAEITIFSTSPPVGTLFAAWRLYRKYRLPWIVDLRDPLTGNAGYTHLPWQTHRTYALIERAVLRASAFTVANTDEAQRMLLEKYPRESNKIKLLWNGFDPQNRLTAQPVPKRPYRVFSHVGELYLGRTAVPLVESVARLIQSGRLSAEKVRIELVGPAQEDCLPAAQLVREAENAGWLRIHPNRVPKLEADQISRSSDGLLIIQPHSAVQVPAKLFDYVQIGRPILAIVPRKSSIEGVLRRSGAPFRAAYADSPAAEFDAALIEYFNLPSDQVSPGPWFEETFNAERQTALLASWIHDANRSR